jgi:cation diffusion facilitator CzcD-associated flavoprotein CzcO
MPNKLGIEGEQNFEGQILHSARWDHSVVLKDKRVAIIGNGCKPNAIICSNTAN